MKHLAVCWFVLSMSLPLLAQEKKTREQKVREDRARVEAEGFWIYNDIPTALARGKETGKPILVVLRCLPCEECVKLDDELVDQDPVIRPLLEKFVCVRQVSTNGLDLSLFQFDTDQSFAVFMLNADRTIYGRFGTRSHRTEWIGDVSLPGLAKALTAALELHAAYPANRASLVGKQGQPWEVTRPEEFAEHRGRYTDHLDYAGNVVQSCIHCHQIGDARRGYYRDQGQAIPETILFPAPHPKVVGLTMDPEEMASVLGVEESSPAQRAGVVVGDRIVSMQGQPLISIADLQWVLSQVAADGGTVAMELQRGDKTVKVSMSLSAGWRRVDDLSWRVSSWGLRRMVTGGLVLESLSDDERRDRHVPHDQMALRVKYVGQYGPHAAGRDAGFQVDDVITRFDGQTNLTRETDVLVYGVASRRPGDQVPVHVDRNGQSVDLMLPMQK